MMPNKERHIRILRYPRESSRVADIISNRLLNQHRNFSIDTTRRLFKGKRCSAVTFLMMS